MKMKQMKAKLRDQLTNEGPTSVHADIAWPSIVQIYVFNS